MRGRSLNSRVAVTVLSLAFLAMAQLSHAQESIAIQVQVEPLSTSKLRIRLTNASPTDVTLYSSKLPWATRYSMIIAAARLTGTNEVLTNTPAIDDPPPGEVVIGPGQAITGEVDLAMRFHQSWQSARAKPVLVFWSYQLQSSDGRQSNRVSGAVEMTPG